MNRLAKSIVLIGCLSGVLALPSIGYALPAFPGAEGWGTETPGGRGGQVVEVTSLADYSAGYPNYEDPIPGTLRYAIEEVSGPRIVVFRIGGTIEIVDRMFIQEPFITIAGQTAPGGGITIKPVAGYQDDKFFAIYTHDVVIRCIRFRPGDENVAFTGTEDWHALITGGSNIVVDHCSLSWGLNETVHAWGNNLNVTFSWNIFSEPLGQVHPYGPLFGGPSDRGPYPDNISIHHNLFAHNGRRSPQVQGVDPVKFIGNYSHYDVRNNLVYNFGRNAAGVQLYAKVNYIGNYIDRSGPKTQWLADEEGIMVRGLIIESGEPLDVINSRVYLDHNIDELYRPVDIDDPSDPNYIPELEICGRRLNETIECDPIVLLPEPISAPLVTTHTPEEAYDLILENAGAIAPKRDSVDERIINDVITETGPAIYIFSQDDVGGWPYLEPGTPPVDDDHDGMPDNWEQARGGDIDPNVDRTGDGYTNIEEYINSLVIIPGALSITATPDIGTEPLFVQFSVQGLPPELASAEFDFQRIKWDFGDGGMTHFPEPGRLFVDLGTHNVKLTIYDEQGNQLDQAQTTITVNEFIPTRELYVSPTGNDAWDGSAPDYVSGTTGPWKTVQHAAYNVLPGDMVYFREGTYHIQPDGNYGLKFKRGGTPDNAVVFRNYPGERPKWDLGGVEYGIGLYTSAGFMIFDGIEAFNTSRYLLMHKSDHTVFRNCIFHTSVGDDIAKLTPDAIHTQFLNNEFYNYTDNAIDIATGLPVYVIIKDNLFRDPHPNRTTYDEWDIMMKGGTGGHEVYHNTFLRTGHQNQGGVATIGGRTNTDLPTYEASNIVFHDNLIINLTGRAFLIWDAYNCHIYNNTIIRTEAMHWGLIHSRIDLLRNDKISIKNNIFYTPGESPIFMDMWPDSTADFVMDNNLWYPVTGTPFNWNGVDMTFDEFVAATGNSQNAIKADPLFVDSANNDYHLNSNSPAIDAGDSGSTSAFDYDANPRNDSAPDIGAYEYQGNTPPPAVEGDYNNDGKVNFDDLMKVILGYGSIYTFADLMKVILNYGYGVL